MHTLCSWGWAGCEGLYLFTWSLLGPCHLCRAKPLHDFLTYHLSSKFIYEAFVLKGVFLACSRELLASRCPWQHILCKFRLKEPLDYLKRPVDSRIFDRITPPPSELLTVSCSILWFREKKTCRSLPNQFYCISF